MTEPLPLISIVLPTYNGSRHLGEAIESCLKQSHENWELIIVDDASNDETPQVIASFAAREPRIRAVRNSPNRKLPASLNIGFAQSRGAYLTWTSDDNVYRAEALAKMLAFLRDREDVDLVYASYGLIDERGAALPRWEGSPHAGEPTELAWRNPVGACFLYRREVHERLGGYAEDLVLVEDYDFWLRASTRFRLAWLDEDLYAYRWHDASLTSTQPQRVRLALEKCLARNLPQMSWVASDVRAGTYRSMVMSAMERQDRRAAWRFLGSALQSEPRSTIRWAAKSLPYLALPVSMYRMIRERDGWEWIHRVHLARHELGTRIPAGSSFIFVDEAQLGRGFLPGRHDVPFMEKDGHFWGPPPDDQAGIDEIERLRSTGATFIAFAWPAFWWLKHYTGLAQYLRNRFKCLTENGRLVVFDLRQPQAEEGRQS